nr:MAG TPA: hypothetical protein [Caudoviricetes sp.]
MCVLCVCLCVRVFDGVGRVLCCVWWVDVILLVWRMVCGVSDSAPVCGVILRG